MFLFHHVDEDRYVGFTERNKANQYGKVAKGPIRSFVVTVDPPVLWQYEVIFRFDINGFRCVLAHIINRIFPGEVETRLDSEDGEWIVYVMAENQGEAIAKAKSFIVENIVNVKEPEIE
jgi:hypothetical protein